MLLRRVPDGARSSFRALALAMVVAGCGGAPRAAATHAAAATCDPSRLDACERAIDLAMAEGHDARALVIGYAQARAARDAGDPWAAVLRELGPRGGAAPKAAVIVEGGAPERAAGVEATWIRVAKLPAPAAIDAEALLLAMGQATGREIVVLTTARHRARATELFPGDPLAPFMAGLAPIARGAAAGGRARLADDIALAALVRRALDAAGAFRYVEAASIAEALAAAIAGRDPLEEPVLRARYALMLLDAAGIALDDDGDAAARPARASPSPLPPPSPDDTPYGDLLRVRTARDVRAAWSVRREAVLRAVAADRREALDDLLGAAGGCGTDAPAPPMDGARDLVFAARLATALSPEVGASGAPARRRGALQRAPWLRRYEALVGAVDATRTMWAYAPSVLHERGGALGVSPAGSAIYRRVTELGVAHLDALRALAESAPLRYRALAQIPLTYSPGVLADERLRDAVTELTRVAVQRRLAEAKGTSAVWGGVLAGVFAGMSYPPAVQSAHNLALQGALTAKLRGELASQTGWEVAALYAGDAIYRRMSGRAPDLAFSSAQIGRALAPDASLPYPGLAAIVAGLSRYGALAATGKLDLRGADERGLQPERAPRGSARDALRRAIAGLGDGDSEPPPSNLLDDVTALADGVLAALAGEASRNAPADAPSACAAKARERAAPWRALGRLGDVRRRILLAPRYRSGDGAWIRRVRLFVTLLSDAIDLLEAPGGSASRGGGARRSARARFTIPVADAEATVAAALRDVGDRSLADALAGGYALARATLEATTPEQFTQRAGEPLAHLLRGLRGVIERGAGPGSVGSALLDALGSAPLDGAPGDLTGVLVGYAQRSSAAGLRDQEDLWLLASLAATAITGGGPPPEAIALATTDGSRVAWALRFLSEIDKARRTGAHDPSAYADAMKQAAEGACQSGGADDVLAVTAAIRDFGAGKRAEARAALDRILDAAEARGLRVPRMTYRYEEKTATRVLALSVDVSYGAGLLDGSSGFQLGLGLRSRGAPEGTMSVALAPDDAPETGEDAARYYVHAAALAAAYHYLDGDAERGAADARRAASAMSFGVRLGPRALSVDRPLAWGRDARALLAIDAQLAAEAGQPFLAGDLWTLAKALLRPDTDDRAVARLLEPLPAGLVAAKDVQPLVARATRSLAALAAPLACTEARIELGAYEEPSCDAYPLALSLRIADVLKKLPHLRRAGSAAQCPAERAVDGFLTAAERGTYDPDAFTAALEALRAAGRAQEAGVLLARHRRDGHCSAAILGAARALGRSGSLGPALRADVLSVAVNCAARTLAAGVVDDLVALDRETRRLPDLGRNLKLSLFVSELALRAQRWDVVATLAAEPDFVDRWLKVSPDAATAALVIRSAAAALSPAPGGETADDEAYALLCGTFPPGDRAELCAQIARLRVRGLATDQRQKEGREALEKLVASAHRSGP